MSTSATDQAVTSLAQTMGEVVGDLQQDNRAIIEFVNKLNDADLSQLVSLTQIAGVGEIYASVEDTRARFGDDLILVSDKDNNGELNVRNVVIALVDATHEINIYVGRRYQLPPNPVPPILSRICSDIAMYRLSTNSQSTDDVRKRYEDSIKQLRNISEGNLSLGIAEVGAGEDEAGYANEVEVTANPRTFNRAASRIF